MHTDPVQGSTQLARWIFGACLRSLPCWIGMGFLLLATGGCRICDVEPFVDTRPTVSRFNATPNEPISRVVVVPMASIKRDAAYAEELANQLAQQLRSRGLFEVVVLSARDVRLPNRRCQIRTI